MCRVLDFLAASQILALICILHYGFVQFFLNKEAAKASILKKMGKNGVPKAFKVSQSRSMLLSI
jgi:hypothetical protein